MPDPLSISELKSTIRRVREIGAIGGEAREDPPPPTIEVHWLQITSTTKVGEWYPAERYPANAAGDGFEVAAEACYLFPPNDTALTESVFYPTHLFGFDEDSGLAVYALLIAGAAEIVTAQTRTEVECINGDLYTMTFVDGELTDVLIEEGCCSNSGGASPNGTDCESEHPQLNISIASDVGGTGGVLAECLSLPAGLDADICITYTGSEVTDNGVCDVWFYGSLGLVVEIHNCDGVWNACVRFSDGTYAGEWLCGWAVGDTADNCDFPTSGISLSPSSNIFGGVSFSATLDDCAVDPGQTTCCPSDTFPTTMTATITGKSGYLGNLLPDSLTFTYNPSCITISNSWCATFSHPGICDGATIGFALWCAGPEYGANAGWRLVAVIPNRAGSACAFIVAEGSSAGAAADTVTCATKTVVFNNAALSTFSQPPLCDCDDATGDATFTFTP